MPNVSEERFLMKMEITEVYPIILAQVMESKNNPTATVQSMFDVFKYVVKCNLIAEMEEYNIQVNKQLLMRRKNSCQG